MADKESKGGSAPPEEDSANRVFGVGDKKRLIGILKRTGILLNVDPNELSLRTAPNEGFGHHLNQVVKGSSEKVGWGPFAQHKGVEIRGCKLTVTDELLTELNEELQDDMSQIRRCSDWTIRRCFTYLDISDFSKYPPAQQALIIRSLVGLVADKALWPTEVDIPNELPEAQLCIGDGYIYVHQDAETATNFACWLASLIEVRGSKEWLPVRFHFRMSVHIGNVFCFWDPGRSGWNYIGEGINEGGRVLEAVGKDIDDVIYVSGELRDAVLTEGLHSLFTNVGRRKDKHNKSRRVFMLDQTGQFDPRFVKAVKPIASS